MMTRRIWVFMLLFCPLWGQIPTVQTRVAADLSAEPEGLWMHHEDPDEANSRRTIGEEGSEMERQRNRAIPRADRPLPGLEIGVLVDGPSPYLTDVQNIIEYEVTDLLYPELQATFPPQMTLIGDWTSEDLADLLDELLENPQIEMVVTVGVLSSTVAALHGNLQKPVFATGVLDDAVPFVGNQPNFSFVEMGADLLRDMRVFHELVPFDRAVVLLDNELYRELPYVEERVRQTEKELGVHISLVTVSKSAEQALANIPPDAQVVYLTPLLEMSEPEQRELIAGLKARGLPSFSMTGEDDVKEGVLLGLAPASDVPRLGRRIALNVQRVLMGEEPSQIPTSMMGQLRLSYNRTTGEAIGITLPWNVLDDAMVVGGYKLGMELTMGSALEQVLSASPTILAERYNVRAGCGEVGMARSRLLPQLDVFGEGRIIDWERARDALGRNPERLIRGSASFSQMIYNDRDVASYQIERYRQEGRKADLRTITLNVLFEVGAIYINLLRLKSLLKIEGNNLELTRKNLLFAEIRKEVGTARANELYRWESQLASNKDAVAAATAAVKVAEAQLNRLLNRPSLCKFFTQERGLEDLLRTIGLESITNYIQDADDFQRFTQFQIWQGWQNAPELVSLCAAIKAQYREVKFSKRNFWLPDFEFFASSEQRIVRGGAGVTPALPVFGRKAPLNDWAVGIRASFPLVQGGLKFSRLYRDKQELCQLRETYKEQANTISFRVTRASNQMFASYLGIDYTASAVGAARKNISFVSDAYARGVVTILDLLDAQNILLRSEQEAVTAQFDFALDLFQLMRAIGRFDFFCSKCEREAWFHELNAYFAQ